MRLKTIWTIHNMSILERIRRSGDWSAMILAGRLPSRVRYWATMIEIAKVTKNTDNIPGMPLDEVLKNLQGGPK